METADLTLLEELIPHNDELRNLMNDHQDFEVEIKDLGTRRWLTVDERSHLLALKKKKLRGRDRIEAILSAHRYSAVS
jgi:uncharacterized protein YdcH (DUF465 family)